MRTVDILASSLAVLLVAACGSSSTQGSNAGADAGAGDAAGASMDTGSSGPGPDGSMGRGDGSTGTTADGGSPPGDGGIVHPGDGGAALCKRGIATNTPPSSALVPTATMPGVTWWYNWADSETGGAAGVQYVPMIWGSASLA